MSDTVDEQPPDAPTTSVTGVDERSLSELISDELLICPHCGRACPRKRELSYHIGNRCPAHDGDA